MNNTRYFGDNLDILREHIAGESVDLIYLDPPFNTKRDYNLLPKRECCNLDPLRRIPCH
jgi:site-specific DNA-methyltransferase (adenine-specific)